MFVTPTLRTQGRERGGRHIDSLDEKESVGIVVVDILRRKPVLEEILERVEITRSKDTSDITSKFTVGLPLRQFILKG